MIADIALLDATLFTGLGKGLGLCGCLRYGIGGQRFKALLCVMRGFFGGCGGLLDCDLIEELLQASQMMRTTVRLHIEML